MVSVPDDAYSVNVIYSKYAAALDLADTSATPDITRKDQMIKFLASSLALAAEYHEDLMANYYYKIYETLAAKRIGKQERRVLTQPRMYGAFHLANRRDTHYDPLSYT